MHQQCLLTIGMVLGLFCWTSTAQLGNFFDREICTICTNARSWDECHQEQCQARQDCYIHVTEDNAGKYVINARCMDDNDDRCKHNHHGGPSVGKRAPDCETCCASDNCNIDHCKHLKFTDPVQHGDVDHCLKCELHGFTWDCDKYEKCNTNQVCFLQQLQTAGFVHVPYFHGGCTDQSRCDVVHVESFSNEHHNGEVTQGACCYNTACNNLTMFTQNNNGHTTSATQPISTELATAPITTQGITTIPQSIPANSEPATTPKQTTTQEPTTTPQSITGSTTSAVDHCMQCVNEGIGWDCSRIAQCKTNEVCFVQKLHLSISIPSIADIYYHGGCISNSECSTVATTSVEDEHGLATVVEGTCCLSNDCNKQIMEQYKVQTTTPMPTTTITTTTTEAPSTQSSTTAPITGSSPVDHCMQCVNEGVAWNCVHTQQCDTDKVCFVQELKLSISIPGIPSTYFHGGCISKSVCSTVGSTSVNDEHGLADVVKGECCYSSDCNRQIKQNYETGPLVHTTTPATAATTTPLSHQTTTPPTTTEAPSTQPPTTAHTTQTPIDHCMECVNEGVVWNCGNTQQCDKDKVCFVQELTLSVSIPGIPSAYYHGGCISKSVCSTVASTSIYDEHGLANVMKGECCYSNDCNRQIKQTYETGPLAHTTTATAAATTPLSHQTTTPPPTTITTTEAPSTPPPTTASTTQAPIDHCMECVNEGVVWNCGNTQQCDKDKVCFVQELKLSVSIPGIPSTYYHGGCISKSECITVGSTSVNDEHGLADVLKGECCYSNDCNIQIKQNYEKTTTRHTRRR